MNPASTLERFGARLREGMVALYGLRRAEDCERYPAENAGPDEAGTPSEGEFNGLALELFALQFEQNQAYRKLCESRYASPARTADWREIPAAPAAAFKELELSCIPAHERTVVFFSSGTTGQRPSRHAHHKKSLEIYEASLVAWFAANLLESMSRPNAGPAEAGTPNAEAPRTRWRDAGAPGVGKYAFPLRGLALTPPRAQAPHSSLAHMFDTLRRTLSLTEFGFAGRTADDGTWVLNCSAAVDVLQDAVNHNEPVMLLGTAFSYVHLLDYLAERDLSLYLPAGSRVMETGGYKGRSRELPKSELHSLIEALLGVPPGRIVCEYGMSELSSQAYDRVAGRDEAIEYDQPAMEPPAVGRYFRFPPWARARIISPETGREVEEGETGLLRVCDLANVYSVMAVQTEDLAIRRGEGFELLGRAALAEARGCSLMER